MLSPIGATADEPSILILPAGEVRARDGDDLRAGKVRVRLWGIDAPELDQTCQRNSESWKCGESARLALQAMVAGKQVTCAIMDVAGRSGRLVGDCRVGSKSLNDAMVRSGNAVAFRKYSMSYTAAEDEAKRDGRGIWSGAFMMPWDWRHR